MTKKKEKIGISFNGLDERVDNYTTKKSSYLSTGSIVFESDGKIGVLEEQIDKNPHPPVFSEHIQRSLRVSKDGKRPKKIDSKIIKDMDHQVI